MFFQSSGIDMLVNERFRIPSFVNEGMHVIAPFRHEGRETGLRCTVAVAAGTSARVVNEKFNFDRWFSLDELRIDLAPLTKKEP